MTKREASETFGTVQRVIEVIRFFSERGDATLKELSLSVSLAPSTCHRLLELLGNSGLIEQDPVGRRYRIGRELFRIAALVQSKNDIRATAMPFLRKLVDACDETSVLCLYLPAEHKLIFAELVESSMMLRYQPPMNVPVSVLWGASGRSILAFLDKDEVGVVYASEGRAPGSGEVLPSRRALEGELATIRARGYDITYGQRISGAVGIAAPVFGADGKVLGSLCVTVPKTRIAAKDRPRLGAIVRNVSHELSVALGASEKSTKPQLARAP